MIPYVVVSPLRLGPLTLQPFGILVAMSTRGWYIVAACVSYAPVRFVLDFLRLDDPHGGDLRYASLTPAQWACIALFAFGVGLASRILRGARPALPSDSLREPIAG